MHVNSTLKVAVVKLRCISAGLTAKSTINKAGTIFSEKKTFLLCLTKASGKLFFFFLMAVPLFLLFLWHILLITDYSWVKKQNLSSRPNDLFWDLRSQHHVPHSSQLICEFTSRFWKNEKRNRKERHTLGHINLELATARSWLRWLAFKPIIRQSFNRIYELLTVHQY